MWISRLKLYLDDDANTVGALVPPMQDGLIDVFETFQNVVFGHLEKEGGDLSEIPTISNIRALTDRLSRS